MEQLGFGCSCSFAATVIEPDFVDAVRVNDDEVVPGSWLWADAVVSRAVAKLYVKPQGLQSCAFKI